MKKILFLTSVIMMTGAAFADYTPGTSDVKLYLGANIGYSEAEYADKGKYAEPLKEFDEEYADISFNFGAKFNKYIGAEAFILGSSPCEVELNILGDKFSSELTYAAYGANLIGYLPASETIEFFGSIGIAKYDFTHEYDNVVGGNHDSGDESSDETGASIGLGIMFNFNEHFSVLGKYEYVNIENEWFDALSKFQLGMRYTF